MDKQESDLIDKIRQQFDTGPYPRIPLEISPKTDPSLHIHNLVIPYYLRNKKVINTQDKVILDAGCGTGYKSLLLAEANPNAKIIGIDISDLSIDLARQRLEYHEFNNVEFHTLPIENISDLGIKFDYINCDEVAYFFPNLIVCFQTLKSVLKEDGIIRANLHSSLQRIHFYRAQEAFKMMGLMDENPTELEIELVREIMLSLKEQVMVKASTWKPYFEKDEQAILMNYLMHGDKGSTIPEVFAALRAANLEFISMVKWQQWQLRDLFKERDNLPVFLELALPEISIEQQLHLFELFNPTHRLLDFWCGHPDRALPFIPVAEWELSDWQRSTVHLHPQLKTVELQGELIRCLSQQHPFEISKYMPNAGHQQILLDSSVAACFLPLLEDAQPMRSLAHLWQKLRPLHPVTLQPTSEEEAFEILIQTMTGLGSLGYILLEC